MQAQQPDYLSVPRRALDIEDYTDILRRHWIALGARHGVLDVDGRSVERLIDDIAARTPAVIARVSAQLMDGFPAELADAVFTGMLNAAKRLGL